VVAQFGSRLGRGTYVLTIHSRGVTDLAGNILDERIYTPFPSVNRQPGQPYVAQFVTNGTTPAGPQPYVPASAIAGARAYRNWLGRRF